jgi:hypothetical protein
LVLERDDRPGVLLFPAKLLVVGVQVHHAEDGVFDEPLKVGGFKSLKLEGAGRVVLLDIGRSASESLP